jgi:hypothetical protein
VLAVAGVASAVRPVQDYLERTHVELSAEPSVRLART